MEWPFEVFQNKKSCVVLINFQITIFVLIDALRIYTVNEFEASVLLEFMLFYASRLLLIYYTIKRHVN